MSVVDDITTNGSTELLIHIAGGFDRASWLRTLREIRGL